MEGRTREMRMGGFFVVEEECDENQKERMQKEASRRCRKRRV